MPAPSRIPFPALAGTASVLLSGLAGATAPAVEAAPAASAPSFVGELLAIVLPLAFIILGLLLVLRLLRRRYGLTGKDTPLSVVQILPVGPRERVVLLRTRAGRVLALGVAGNSVNLIARLEEDDVGPVTDAGSTEPTRRGLIDTVRPR